MTLQIRYTAAVGRALACLLAALAIGLPATASAQVGDPRGHDHSQEPDHSQERDHSIVFEIGAAGDWSRMEGFHPGATFAFEVTPIEHWLELEVGVSAIRADGSTEVPVDVLLKKPWQLGRSLEFMIGAGPEIIHATGPNSRTFWGIEAVADLMFWPSRNLGWYVEPGYEATFPDGMTKGGMAIAVGLLIGR
ncbi:MAG TPA: hypothetical protein VMS04_22475 [Vicinamibacterales bacterium]|nr:hypothetical protein [Vicinamibacterales bacterium]